MLLAKLKKELEKCANKRKAKGYSWFFKTGKGQYGQGDVFIGITVPQQRKIAKKYSDISLSELAQLLKSVIHEHRLTALLVLAEKYKKANTAEKRKIFNFYIKNIQYVNNWDLVDLSAPSIVGEQLQNTDKTLLYALAKSQNLWKRRIAIIATLAFIRKNKFGHTLKISKLLLKDRHDLIHKAVGWMLREVGKRDEKKLEKFLLIHCAKMPRIALRYAIERFNEKQKRHWLQCSKVS